MKVSWISVFLIGLVLCMGGRADEGQEARPVALVGSEYGRHEVRSIVRNIFDHEDWHFEEKGTFLPAEEFKDYSLVIIASSQERPYTTEEHQVIREYLDGGGHLLLIQRIGAHMADAESKEIFLDWLGMTVARIKLDPESVHIADSKLLEGVVAPDGERPSWIRGTHGVKRIDPGVEILIGDNDDALVAKRDVGKGWVVYLGSELFRLRAAKSEHLESSDSYLRLVRNIIAEAEPLRIGEWRESLNSTWRSQGKRYLLWNREWQRGTEYEPVFLPPLPSNEELVSQIKVDMALDEYEAVSLNLTDLGEGGLVTWKIDGLPSESVEVFVQDKPDPIPWPKNPAIAKESPFWLMPPQSLEPKGEDAVLIGTGKTRIFWLKFDSHQLSPGVHKGRMEFLVDGKSAGHVDLDLTIYPVRVPTRRLITVQPFGHVYGDVNNPEPAIRFKRNLRDHGFEWSLINTLRPSTFTVNGQALTARFIEENLGAIQSDQPPFIDFSSMDGFIDAAIAHNLTYFRITQNLTESIRSLTRTLPEETQKAVRRWYLGEFLRYLQDKGIRNAYVSMGDELSTEELKSRFLPWSEELAEVGLKSTSSFTTGSVADPEVTAKLSDSVGAWTLNRLHVAKFMDWVAEGKVPKPDGVLVGSYGAGEGRGTEIRKNATESRMIGWEAWALGTDYCAPNPYFKGWIYYADYSLDRGIGGERFVSYLDIDDLDAPLVNSPFIEGIRESIEEANLAAIMSWFIQKLGDRVPKDLIERADKVVGESEDSILQWQPRQYGSIESAFVKGTREQYAAAKSEVLEILGELSAIARSADLQPSLYWNMLPLVQDGIPKVQLVGDHDVSPIQNAVKEAVDRALPETDDREQIGEKPTLVVAAIGSDVVPAWMKEQLGVHPDSYSWIREMRAPGSDQTVIWVGGTDAGKVDKAMDQFVHFLRPEGAWFVQ